MPEAAGAKVLARYRKRNGPARSARNAWAACEHASIRSANIGRWLTRRSTSIASAGGNSRSCSTRITGPAACWAASCSTELGCEVTLLGGEPDGQFEHRARTDRGESGAACWPPCRAVGADIGFCQDPDADRLAVIDDAGSYLGEEYTLAMCVDASVAQPEGTGRDQLLDQPHGAGRGREVRRAVFSLGGRRGQRRRSDARARRP